MLKFNVKNNIKRVQDELVHFQNHSLEDLIWIKCDLESNQKFQDDTTSSQTSIIISMTIPMITFIGSLVALFATLPAGQAKVFTGEDKEKTGQFLKEVGTFVLNSSNLIIYTFAGTLIVLSYGVLFFKSRAKKNHLRLLIVNELIEKKRLEEAETKE